MVSPSKGYSAPLSGTLKGLAGCVVKANAFLGGSQIAAGIANQIRNILGNRPGPEQGTQPGPDYSSGPGMDAPEAVAPPAAPPSAPKSPGGP